MNNWNWRFGAFVIRFFLLDNSHLEIGILIVVNVSDTPMVVVQSEKLLRKKNLYSTVLEQGLEIEALRCLKVKF